MSGEQRAIDVLVEGAIDFLATRDALKSGTYWPEEEREGLRAMVLCTLAYLSTKAREIEQEEAFGAFLSLVSKQAAR